jgi:hypothetical protein
MLHLAQVQKNPATERLELYSLAFCSPEAPWRVIAPHPLPPTSPLPWSDGVLLLVEMTEGGQITQIAPAAAWVLELVELYLSGEAITPEAIAETQAQLEQWRQEVVVQNQDLTRRHLELEARRDELQRLEESLKDQREELQRWEKQLRRSQEEEDDRDTLH